MNQTSHPRTPPVSRTRAFLAGYLVFCLLAPVAGLAAEANIADSPKGELRLFLLLAGVSRAVYEDGRDDLIATPSGCVAMVRRYDDGSLVIAFRGSMLGDRDPDRRPFSNFGGKIVRRNYRDWVATNLKQTAGFLPRQYIEAAELTIAHLRKHPDAGRVWITGHSKGGGAAEYAAVAAWLSPEVGDGVKERIAAVTFNAAVVRERNWRRLYRSAPRDRVAMLRRGEGPPVAAVVMRDDPVSKIAAGERSAHSRLLVIDPAEPLAAAEQHGIASVIAELRRLAAR